MLNQWTLNILDLHFLLSPLKVSSPSMLPGTRMLNPTTRIIIPSRNNQKGCVQKPKKHSDKRKHRTSGQSLNIRTAQIQSSTGRWTCLTSLHNMLRKWKDLGKFWISLIPGRPCLGPLQLEDEKGQQELRPRGPSAMLPLNPILKDGFEKFEQDFLASNLPEGKYIKPPASTAKYYKAGQPCFENKLQKLPKASGAPVGKAPLQVLKELEHQARQNISTINFTVTFSRIASSCNTVMEKCQHSIKARTKFKRVPIPKELPDVVMKTPVIILKS